MDLKFLYPNAKKLIFSAAAAAVWAFIIITFQPYYRCLACAELCVDAWPRILRGCGCCFTFKDFVYQLSFVALLPFAVAYLAYSGYEFFKGRKK